MKKRPRSPSPESSSFEPSPKRARSISPGEQERFADTHHCRDPQPSPIRCKGPVVSWNEQYEIACEGCEDDALVCSNCAYERFWDGAPVCFVCRNHSQDVGKEVVKLCDKKVKDLETGMMTYYKDEKSRWEAQQRKVAEQEKIIRSHMATVLRHVDDPRFPRLRAILDYAEGLADGCSALAATVTSLEQKARAAHSTAEELERWRGFAATARLFK